MFKFKYTAIKIQKVIESAVRYQREYSYSEGKIPMPFENYGKDNEKQHNQWDERELGDVTDGVHPGLVLEPAPENGGCNPHRRAYYGKYEEQRQRHKGKNNSPESL